MDIIIRDDYGQMSREAARVISDQIKAKPNCVLGLATGATPIGTYQELGRLCKEEGLDFSQVKTFNLDEYLGVGMDPSQPYSLDQSYARFMHEELFSLVNIKPENTYVPDGKAQDPVAFCRWYEEEIAKAGGIDLQLLGLGGDGHWGFNEPGTSLASRTHIQALTKQTLDDNYEAFYRKAGVTRDEMPHFAITMGIGTILDAKSILLIVNGAKKASVVAASLEGPVTSQVTASAIQLHPGSITVILDEPASSALQHADHYRHVEQMKARYGL